MKHKSGFANNALVIVLGSLLLLGILMWLLLAAPEDGGGSAASGGDQPSLLVYCAAGMKTPVAAAAEAFQRELGIEVQLQYGGSGTLLNNLRVAKKGDLYLAADAGYIQLAREQDVLDEAVPLARMRPVIAVQKGNPKNIRSLDDLFRDDVKVALANPEAASVGQVTKAVLETTGQWEALSQVVKVFKPTVNDIATDVAIGTVDAAVVWDTIVRQFPKLDMVTVPAFDEVEQEVTIGVLKSCDQPATALKFARYLQAPEKGQREFEKAGYETVDGDAWDESPTLLLFSGGVNRVAIEQTLQWFEQREGVRINRSYNGCGILVGQVRGGSRPDGYFACDTSYMVQVQDQFQSALDLSETDMIVIVQAGNPKGIRSVNDLTQDGLKLGIANEEQSALGALTRRLFEKIDAGGRNLYDAIQPNIKVRTPTADLLVNQLRTGALDAAVVYQANVALVADKLEVIPIREGDPTAVQPIAVGKDSRYKHLMARLIDALQSDRSRTQFETHGFRWHAGAGTP